MRELFRLLEPRQKRILAWAAGVLAAAVLFLIFAFLGSPRRLERRSAEVQVQSRQLEMAEAERTARRAEVSQWKEARRDIETLRKKSFFAEEEGVNALRLVLQEIFSRAGLRSPETKFDYATLEKEEARKVSITFNFEGSYSRLKEFLAEVEKEDCFLFVERIVFMNIDSGGGNLLLKMTLAAYYAL